MDYLQQSFTITFEYKVIFTEHLFSKSNAALKEFFNSQRTTNNKKIFVVLDSGVTSYHTSLEDDIRTYFNDIDGYTLIPEILKIEGGEYAKNNPDYFYQLVNAVDTFGIDRHSYIIAIGGGSILDLVGYAAAVSHRGIRHIRVPTTVLSQNDSGVGVKNGINYLSKKNFLGTFVPPVAVFNDAHFLTTLSDEEWRSGTSEAVKVALIKDKDFFDWLEKNAASLALRDMKVMKVLIERCAKMHIEHIAGGDPFEMGSSRPLDFGHWSAHKVEQLSNFFIRHGEAVALGIALDSTYSWLAGRLSEAEHKRIISVLKTIGFSVTNPLMQITDEKSPVLLGLNEFREHLGGELTIMLLDAIGKGVEVHELNVSLLIQASHWLREQS